MPTPRTTSSPRSTAERAADNHDFWERRADGSSEPRKAAFADTVASVRKRLIRRKHRP